MKKCLLIIDDDEDLGEVFHDIFSEDDYDIHFYSGTDDIFDLLEQHQPNLVILDYNLNGTNGGELCKRIKNSNKYHHIPVMLLSAFPRFIYQTENFGYDVFLEKPFEVAELKLIVEDKLSNE
ncbi:response regulator [Pedobacter sp.]|uniref:response regulator n=1 Tax=Pedobacter sp. TaxID=1411316 RepID=UPI003D7F4BA5